MTAFQKRNLPVERIRKYLEPGPIVLVSSAWKDETNIMTMGWYTVMEFTPSLIGCVIAGSNHSYEMIRKSRECVINIPTVELAKTVVGIGNCSGEETRKFEKFGLTAETGKKVKAPLIKECYANLECKIHDAHLLNKYNFFIFKVVRAIAATSPKYPRTIHYTGDGIFMVSGKHLNLRKQFKPEMLRP